MRNAIGPVSVLALGVSALLPPATAFAATTLDQPPDGVLGLYSDESYDLLGFPSQVLAENFDVDTVGSGFTLEEIVVWGGFGEGNTPPAVDDIDVLVHVDNSGIPGAVICSEVGVPASRIATGLVFGGSYDEYRVTIDLSSPCILTDGPHWVEVYYNTGPNTDNWMWESAQMDPIYGNVGIAYAREAPGVSWFLEPTFNVATQLNGTVGVVHCVDSSEALVTALDLATFSGLDDVIRVVQGSYNALGSAFLYDTTLGKSLSLLGGYTPGCSDRVLDPSNTTLSGSPSNPSPVLLLEALGGSGDLHLQGFTIRNGESVGSDAGGAQVVGVAGFSGDVTVDFNVFTNNHATTEAGGLAGGSDLGLTRIENNLFVGNSSDSGWGAGHLTGNGTNLYLTNNTVADNTCGGCDGGLTLSGSTATVLSNNILWGNENDDLVFSNPATLLEHNDIGSYTGTPDPASHDNWSVNPLFLGLGNYRLEVSSGLIDQGTDTPLGGLPIQDLDGNPRSVGSATDMGAYESSLLFADGFESGDTSAWSATVP